MSFIRSDDERDVIFIVSSNTCSNMNVCTGLRKSIVVVVKLSQDTGTKAAIRKRVFIGRSRKIKS